MRKKDQEVFRRAVELAASGAFKGWKDVQKKLVEKGYRRAPDVNSASKPDASLTVFFAIMFARLSFGGSALKRAALLLTWPRPLIHRCCRTRNIRFPETRFDFERSKSHSQNLPRALFVVEANAVRSVRYPRADSRSAAGASLLGRRPTLATAENES